jgi:RNA polymerase sigma factor (sigma-70 family)
MSADFSEFFDSQSHKVVAFLMQNGASLQDAEDAAQQALVDAWKLSQDRVRWEKIRNPEGWIREVARRKYLRPPGPRRRPPTQAGDLPEMPSLQADPGELTPATLDLLAALRTLDDEARAVMAYRMDGFNFREIADAMGIYEQRARDIQKRTRRILMRILGNGDGQDGRSSQ